MNVLPRHKQDQVIAALVEGASVRSIERLTGVHRDNILCLMVRVGRHCYLLMDKHIRNVECEILQCDELFSYVGKKDQRIKALTVRMHSRRLTRLTNAFSKKLENLVAALCVHFAWYNFVRVHKTLRCTPAMAADVTTRLWKIGDLLPA